MARILLVEDTVDLGAYEALVLEGMGHRMLRCDGAPSFGGVCSILKTGSCAVADAADLILFGSSLFMPMRGRSYNGGRVLRAYRAHPVYGRLPMLVVTVGAPEDLGGTGPIEILPKFSDPDLVIAAVNRLLAQARPQDPKSPAGSGPAGPMG
jgi:hypothetical protein